MHAWALIVVIAMESSPQLMGTFKTQEECREQAERIEAESFIVRRFKANTGCFKLVEPNFPQG
jgi:hypothetical protein